MEHWPRAARIVLQELVPRQTVGKVGNEPKQNLMTKVTTMGCVVGVVTILYSPPS